MKKSLLVLFAAMMVLSVTTESRAAASRARLGVSGSVLRRCGVSTVPVNFGTILASNDRANGQIKVTCTRGLPYKLYIDGGSNQSGANASRRIKNTTVPTATMFYRLFRTGVTQWGTTGCASVLCNPTYTGGTPWAATGTGALQTFTVFGRTLSFNTIPGAYVDSTDTIVEF